MKDHKSLLAIPACIVFLMLILGTSASNAAGPQSASIRRDAKNPRNTRSVGANSRTRRAETFRPRSAPAFPTWAYALQGDREDEARGVFSTSEGGVIFWGDTRILGGMSQAWMTKLSSQGLIEWSRVYDAAGRAVFSEVAKTRDGGYIAAGRTGETAYDAVILKLSDAGLPEWGTFFGGASGDKADSVQQTADGGYIAAGVTNEYITSDFGDFWVSKLSPLGAVEWSSVFRGPDWEGDWNEDEKNVTVRQSADGGYFLAGDSNSFGMGGYDIWILKLSSAGVIEWQRTFGGSGSETFPNSGPHFVITPDQGLIVACTTTSFGATASDGWLLKVSSTGDIVWQKRIGGPQSDTLNAIQPTSDGGYALGGFTRAIPDDGFRHAWLVKLDPALDIQWQRYYGTGSNFDIQGLAQGADGSFAAGGCRTPTSRTAWYWDVYRDAFVMKAGPDGVVGVPGSEFSGQSNAVMVDTDAVPQETAISPLPGFSSSQLVAGGSTSVTPQQDLLSWSGLQPPLYLTVTRETNLGLFKGEALNTLQWNPNPWNSRFEVVSYAIYRQPIDGSAPFLRIATVSVNTMAYVDQGLGFNDMFAYLVRSVDEGGNESPISQVVRN
jgi:hypothetical protein